MFSKTFLAIPTN